MSLRFRLAIAALLLVGAAAAAAISSTRETLVLELLVIVLATMIGLGLALSVLRSLGEIQAAAREVAAGNLATRVQFSARPAEEVQRLADAFDDMVERVQQQVEAASQERERLYAAMNSSSDAAVAVARDGRVLFANSAAEAMFEKPALQMTGNPLVWLIADQAVIDAARRSQQGSRETSLIERGGRRFYQVVTTPIVGGGEWAVLVVFNDVTQVKRTELMRRDFVANVSHELRSPLAGIKAVIETLTGGAIDDKAAAGDFLARADHEVDRLIELVEELLELSQIEYAEVPLALQQIDLNPLIRYAVERTRPQAERKQQTLEAYLPREMAPVMADPPRLERALLSLLHNAIKFTPEGGRIAVKLEMTGRKALIQVTDDGVGISMTEQARIFERFYKSDQSRGSSGSGLGLAIVKHTMEAHGGTVEVVSEPGLGSTFTLSLPLIEGDPPEDKAHARRQAINNQ